METLSTFITLLIFYGLGFFAGLLAQKNKLEQTISDVKRKIDVKTSPVGVVYRPTAEQLAKRTDPFEKKIEEGKDAMRETLRNIKELK